MPFEYRASKQNFPVLEKSISVLLDTVSKTFIVGKTSPEKKMSKLRFIAELRAPDSILFISAHERVSLLSRLSINQRGPCVGYLTPSRLNRTHQCRPPKYSHPLHFWLIGSGSPTCSSSFLWIN